MEFTAALRRDLPELSVLYREATRRMDEQGVFQWDRLYPTRRILADDIARQELEIGRIDGRIAVSFALESCVEGEYEAANWQYRVGRFVVLHRLCVHPAFQGRGVAKEAMDYIEDSVCASGIESIRLDAFSQNPAALRLYTSRGYEKAGEINYRKGLFFLYEKKL